MREPVVVAESAPYLRVFKNMLDEFRKVAKGPGHEMHDMVGGGGAS